jgi:hypothetical protein
MTALPTEGSPSLHLVTIGAVAAATIMVFFGVGFLWLRAPDPVALPGDPAPAANSLEGDAAPPPATNDTALGWSVPANNLASSGTPDAQPDREARSPESAMIATTITTLAKPSRTKTIVVTRHRHRPTVYRPMVSWRLNAYPGPNPGGGFYGPPNINVGQINPR